MNLLFDFITPRMKTGAGEYQRRVFFELTKRLRTEQNGDVKIFALWDSSKGIAYEDLRPDALRDVPNFEFVDCADRKVTDIAEEKRIDRFFVGCVQFVGEYPEVAQLKCEVLCVILDARDEEFLENHLYEYVNLADGKYDFRDRFASRFMNKVRYWRLTWHLTKWQCHFRHGDMYSARLKLMKPFCQLLQMNQKSRLITISSFSKYSIMYTWGFPENRVLTLWCPERIICHGNNTAPIENELLRQIIASGRKYFLMVSANRPPKNSVRLVRAFEKYCQFNDEIDLVLVGSQRESIGRIHALPFLNDDDLAHAMEDCYALVYPSYFEGFGYPPLEAMKYGKPVLSSNTTSMPEVLGDAPIYFSPFYNSDIFRAMMSLTPAEYAIRSRMSRERYAIVHERQEHDLRKLLDLILGLQRKS